MGNTTYGAVGKCMSRSKALQFFEDLLDYILEEVKDYEFHAKYRAALNTYRWCADRLEPVAPKLTKARSKAMHDYYTCGVCGRILSFVSGTDKYCPECGRKVLWDTPACLTERGNNS